MPANLSSNKIRVTQFYGASPTLGLVEPHLHMVLKHGIDTRWIVGLDSGNFQVKLALTSGGAVKSKAYPHDLVIESGVAALYGWPAGANSPVVFGHHGIFPNGVPAGVGTGVSFAHGDGTVHTLGH